MRGKSASGIPLPWSMTERISWPCTTRVLTIIFAPGSLFPDDEFYDAGVREAVSDIAQVAKPGAVIASDATKVVKVYLERAGRTDMRAISLSMDGLPAEPASETWVLAQDAHTYYENEATLDQIRARSVPAREYHVGGGVAVQVFHYPE